VVARYSAQECWPQNQVPQERQPLLLHFWQWDWGQAVWSRKQYGAVSVWLTVGRIGRFFGGSRLLTPHVQYGSRQVSNSSPRCMHSLAQWSRYLRKSQCRSTAKNSASRLKKVLTCRKSPCQPNSSLPAPRATAHITRSSRPRNPLEGSRS
jgi:hypothetical protein